MTLDAELEEEMLTMTLSDQATTWNTDGGLDKNIVSLQICKADFTVVL